jgi:membrane protease YdiL (CAAX protease family)
VRISGTFHSSAIALPFWFALLYPLVKAVCVGVYEEAISRGYHLTNLMEGLSGIIGKGETGASVSAIVLSSAIFGLLHMRNPNATLMSTLSITLNGSMLGTAFVLTRQLGMPIGLHMSWNLAQGWLFGFPVSGDPEISTILQTLQSGPEWLTGGSFGPEGGMLGLGASAAGILLLIALRRKIKR